MSWHSLNVMHIVTLVTTLCHDAWSSSAVYSITVGQYAIIIMEWRSLLVKLKKPQPYFGKCTASWFPGTRLPQKEISCSQTKQLASRGVSCGRTWSCLGSLALIWTQDLISRSCNPHSNAPLPSQLKASKFLALFLACWKLKSWDTYMRLRDVRCLKPPGKYWHKY